MAELVRVVIWVALVCAGIYLIFSMWSCASHDYGSDIRAADYAWEWIGKDIADYPHELVVKRVASGDYLYRGIYDIADDWVINGVYYDDHYKIFFYVDETGVIYSARVERATAERVWRE